MTTSELLTRYCELASVLGVPKYLLTGTLFNKNPKMEAINLCLWREHCREWLAEQGIAIELLRNQSQYLVTDGDLYLCDEGWTDCGTFDIFETIDEAYIAAVKACGEEKK